jgi:hypothetical protein
MAVGLRQAQVLYAESFSDLQEPFFRGVAESEKTQAGEASVEKVEAE